MSTHSQAVVNSGLNIEGHVPSWYSVLFGAHLLIAISLSAGITGIAEARYDVTTQPTKTLTSSGLDVNYVAASNVVASNVAASNIGQFVGATMDAVGAMGLIQRVEADMDSKNLYIAFRTGIGHLGYAVVQLANQAVIVPPTPMTDGTYDAIGSIPTVACYRWGANTCHIAFAEPGRSTSPVVSDPNVVSITFENEGNSTGTLGSYSCGSYSTGKRDHNGTPQAVNIESYPDSLRLYYNALTHMVEGNPVECQKGLDTMRMYVEMHPYATLGDYVQHAITYTGGFVGYLPDDTAHLNSRLEYNWLVRAQQWNPDSAYQRAILYAMGNSTVFDLNLQANIWYNIILRYGNDTTANSGPYHIIEGLRRDQRSMRPPQDTTAWTILTFPLDTVPIVRSAVVNSATPESNIDLTVVPNPGSSQVSLQFDLPHGGVVTLEMFDAKGAVVGTVLNAPRPAGRNEVRTSVTDLPEGEYFVRLSSGRTVVSRALIVKH